MNDLTLRWDLGPAPTTSPLEGPMFKPDPTTWTVSFSATQMSITFPHHLSGEPMTNLFELHRTRPEGVFHKTGTVTAKNGRVFAYGLIPGDPVRYVAWPA